MSFTSPAVMASRKEPWDSLDFFPTHPWATRSLIKWVLPQLGVEQLHLATAWDPACGMGDMVRPLAESFAKVWGSDVYRYQPETQLGDFLDTTLGTYWQPPEPVDWLVTNSPFAKGDAFIGRALELLASGQVREGVAMFARAAWLESEGRFRLFNRLTAYCPFSERVPLVRGRLDPRAASATAYAWFVWLADWKAAPRLLLIPPGQAKSWKRREDYRVWSPAGADLPLFADEGDEGGDDASRSR